MKALQWIMLALVAVTLVVGGALGLGRWRWHHLTDALVGRLESNGVRGSTVAFDGRELTGLPSPVQRYLRKAIAEGTPPITAVSLSHTGSFNMGETVEEWRPVTSTQRVVTDRPGFVWDGRVFLLPGLAVLVHDAYVAGEGILHPAIAGLYSLADLRGGGDIARGEFLRYIAESAWYPTVLLPSQGARWEAIDERAARVTLSDGGLMQSLTFVFGDDDMVTSVRAETRGRTDGDELIPTPWEGRWSAYTLRQGLRVPTIGEVAWLLPEGRKPYWRGTLTAVHYEFAQR